MTQPRPDTSLIIVRMAPEIFLKARQTRRRFEKRLRDNIERAFAVEGIPAEMHSEQGRIEVHTPAVAAAEATLARVFGVGSFSHVAEVVDGELDDVLEAAKRVYAPILGPDKTFAVRAKITGYKKFRTQDLERQVGAALNTGPVSRVNLTTPDVTVRLDVQDGIARLLSATRDGPGGMPAGVQGKAVALISGGFDSVVAAWMIMKRGAMVDFVFCNLAGAEFERGVLQVTKRLTDLWGTGHSARFFSLDCQPLVQAIQDNVSNDYKQIVLKRVMYRAADQVCRYVRADALITGESLGQVSSQTLSNLKNIDLATDYPVLRPLIGIDKKDIVRMAHGLGTAELSEHIPEYCGLAAKKPAVSSSRGKTEDQESRIDLALIDAAVDGGIAGVRRLDDLDASQLAEPTHLVDTLPEDATLIDCQPEELYAVWHLPEAKHYPPNRLALNFDELPKDRPYVLYCTYGTTSPLLAEVMREAGYDAKAFSGDLKALKKRLG